MNTFGHIFRLTTFGESHGPCVGGVVDGMPAGIAIDMDDVRKQLARRSPGKAKGCSSRNEPDEVTFLSGLLDGVTTGTPIGFVVPNEDARSTDYDQLQQVMRPSHGDYTYRAKYGIYDYHGGGRASARETVCRVVAGALARQALRQVGISIEAYVSQVGDLALEMGEEEKMLQYVREVQAQGDSIGGVVRVVAKGCPAGLGEPVYGKLQSALAGAMLSINAAKGFDYGEGFDGLAMRGSEQNDPMYVDAQGRIGFASNHSGGIQAGISNGQDICFRVAFKPVASISMPQQTVTVQAKPVVMQLDGRHDACVLPRAVPVVEAMTAITLLDYYLLYQSALPFRKTDKQ